MTAFAIDQKATRWVRQKKAPKPNQSVTGMWKEKEINNNTVFLTRYKHQSYHFSPSLPLNWNDGLGTTLINTI